MGSQKDARTPNISPLLTSSYHAFKLGISSEQDARTTRIAILLTYGLNAE